MTCTRPTRWTLFFDLRPQRTLPAEAELETGLGEAIVIGRATLEDVPCQLSVTSPSWVARWVVRSARGAWARACESAAERKFL